MKLPPDAPVMVLPRVVLFPHALLPLHIFEPRYRRMLAECLERNRMFCIAHLKPGGDEPLTEGDFFATGGLGLIRACVANEDGTSNLVLQGLARVRFVSFTQEHPFRIARLRPLRMRGKDLNECVRLAEEVLQHCTRLPAGAQEAQSVHERLSEIDDPEILADVVSHTFVKDPLQLQDLIEQEELPERLRRLLGYLKPG